MRVLRRFSFALAMISLASACAFASGAPATATGSARPNDLRDVSAWVRWKQANHILALPLEARLFYRRGVAVRLAGQEDEALADVRGAAELDPTYVEPHLSLASWTLLRDPSQSLLQYATVLDLLRRDFNLQLALAANGLLLAVETLFAGLVLAAIVLVALRRRELTHVVQEQFSHWITPGTARLWAPVVLVTPFFAGLGLALPTVGLLGYLWPSLRVRERALFVLLVLASVSTPLAIEAMNRFSLALRSDSRPFYGVLTLRDAPASADEQRRLAERSARDPHNPYVQFGLAWTARRGGDLATAEHAYRAVLESWPDHGPTLTDLGNVLAIEGRPNDALELYDRAEKAWPEGAAPHFNASQLHTQRFEYQAATEELAKASALDFELVRQNQAQAGAGGVLPLVDAWLEPRGFWLTLRDSASPAGRPALPLYLHGRLEASGWLFSVLTIAFAALGLLVGGLQHSRLPLRTCSNCGTIICRRCAKRRRESALCPSCEILDSRAETPEFSRVLLLQRRSGIQRRSRLVRTAFAALIPGCGLLAHRHVFRAVTLLGVTWMLLRLLPGYAPPFSIEPRLTLPGDEVPSAVIAAGLVAVYAVSLLAYFHMNAVERARDAQLAATQRGKITQSTRRSTSLAA